MYSTCRKLWHTKIRTWRFKAHCWWHRSTQVLLAMAVQFSDGLQTNGRQLNELWRQRYWWQTHPHSSPLPVSCNTVHIMFMIWHSTAATIQFVRAAVARRYSNYPEVDFFWFLLLHRLRWHVASFKKKFCMEVSTSHLISLSHIPCGLPAQRRSPIPL